MESVGFLFAFGVGQLRELHLLLPSVLLLLFLQLLLLLLLCFAVELSVTGLKTYNNTDISTLYLPSMYNRL